MKPVAILSVDNTTHTKSLIGLQSAVAALGMHYKEKAA